MHANMIPMDERNKGTNSDADPSSLLNTADLVAPFMVGEPDDEELVKIYADRAEEEAHVKDFPTELALSEYALGQKTQLDDKSAELLKQLDSSAVKMKAFYGPGGQGEIIDEIRQIQLAELPRIYADVRYESDYLKWHVAQTTPQWCQLACIENAFRALDNPPVSQDVIAHEAGVHREEAPFPDQMIEYVKSKGKKVMPVSTVSEMIDLLVDGSKTVLHVGYPAVPTEHATLISGIRIEQGKITFLVNNPTTDSGMQEISLERVLHLLQQPHAYNELTNSYAIGNADSEII